MNIKRILAIGMFSTVFYSNIALSEGGKSLGLGAGSIYNGVGMSYGFQSHNQYKYASLGCLSITYSSTYGSELNCGAGIGFVMTDIFNLKGNKHGFGAHLGVTYNEHYSKVETFIAPHYVYYFNGINMSGWNLGGSLRLGKYDDKSDVIPNIQLGYQF